MQPLNNGHHVREDLTTLPAWDPTILWYARGVGAMRKRHFTDPRSWRFQAAIHDYTPSADPLRNAADPPPSTAVQHKFWRRCQHGSWFFLPWHRAYLAFFEQTLRAEIVALGGPSQWALPYWNYSGAASARLVRHELRDANLPNNLGPNPLAQATRGATPQLSTQGAATGDYGLTAADVALKPALSSAPFTGPPGAATFGGPTTSFHHSAGVAGVLENVPHNAVHGGIGGWMGAFNTAGLDPLFWLHHCNIDRLWEVWRGIKPANTNPSGGAWSGAAALAFDFHDANGQPLTLVAHDVEATTAPMLNYVYQSTANPLGPPAPALAATVQTEGVSVPTAPASMDMVGASTGASPLADVPTSAEVSVQAFTPQTALAATGEDSRRVYLNLENITGSDNSAAYEVYLAPAAAPAGEATMEGSLVGLLPTFGVTEASDPEAEHGGSGLSVAFDITDLVAALRGAGGDLKADRLRVTFVPVRRSRPDGNLKVGRVSIYRG